MRSDQRSRGRLDVAVDALAALSEPTRRRVFEQLRASGEPATRDEVAAALGLGRPIVTFHLDALAKAGVVDVDYARPPGRRGPGAGRPAKRYRVAAGEIAARVPARRYDLAGRILAAGVRDATRSGGATDARAATFNAAEATGRQLGEEHAETGADATSSESMQHVCAVLSELGYEPVSDGGAEHPESLRLHNCPFHAVVEVEPELVCQLNVHLLHGLLEGMSVHDLEAQFAPTPGECCVRIAAPGDRPRTKN
ncbi:MAG TPA: helix-turn-helix domain-containing protein [Acidothermaceae bacterium]|nr:helix-turn-helix domain-containing protein [Acidothermaceae bacterium]